MSIPSQRILPAALPPSVVAWSSAVSVVVDCYNSGPQWYEACAGLLGAGPEWKEVIVILPPGAGAGQVRLDFPEVSCVEVGCANHARALNLGYAAAAGEWILTLRGGSVPLLRTWDGLCRMLVHEVEADVISLLHVGSDCSGVGAHRRASLSEEHSFNTAGALIRRDAWSRVGAFDEELSAVGLEWHWAARARALGCSVFHCPDAHVLRPETGERYTSEQDIFFYCRNLLLLVLRYAPSGERMALIRTFLGHILVYSVLLRTPIFWNALWDARRLWRAHPEKVLRANGNRSLIHFADWLGPFRQFERL